MPRKVEQLEIVTMPNGDRFTVTVKTLAEVEIKPGWLYVGKRNQGWQLGTFKFKSPEGWVYDSGNPPIYPYNDYECRKVVE